MFLLHCELFSLQDNVLDWFDKPGLISSGASGFKSGEQLFQLTLRFNITFRQSLNSILLPQQQPH